MVSPNKVALSRMVGVSASANLPLHHKVQKYSSDTGSPGWSRKKSRKTVVVCSIYILSYYLLFILPAPTVPIPYDTILFLLTVTIF